MGLSDDEQRLINGLSTKLTVQSVYVLDRYLYYDGEQRCAEPRDLVPQVLAGVRTVVDWPRICVDRWWSVRADRRVPAARTRPRSTTSCGALAGERPGRGVSAGSRIRWSPAAAT
jgi:hypothetical protein